jgi:ubiquinone/menaquinone biosynthesis C-methylase UbiE
MKGITYDAGAAAYDRFTGRWSIAFGSSLLAAAGVTVGQKVLDVAAGTGALAVMAAAQVGISGRVTAADLSLPMLRVAKGKIAGLAVDPVLMDGQDLACGDRTFDVVICQLGLMFFPDARRGVQEFRRVLRQHGRLAVQVWSWPDRVSFFGVLADALSRHFPDHRDMLYSPAALADPDRLEQLLATAGLRHVSVVKETREIAFESFDEYWSGIEAGGGRLGQFYLELGDRERRAVRDEVSRRMALFESNGRLVLRAEALIAVGINSDP